MIKQHLHVSETFFDTTRITSVAIAFGCWLSRDVATTGNWYSTKYVLAPHTYNVYCIFKNVLKNNMAFANFILQKHNAIEKVTMHKEVASQDNAPNIGLAIERYQAAIPICNDPRQTTYI